jgi:hypothetical protein
MLKKILYFVPALLALSGGARAQCSMIEIPLSQRITGSELIVEGKVTSQHSYWTPNHQMIYTSQTVEVYKLLKGKLVGPTIEILTPGGRVGDQMEISTPSLRLQSGDAGVFTCLQAPPQVIEPGHLPQSIFMTYASSQGFIRYDEAESTASDVFKNYRDVKKEVLDLITISAKQTPTALLPVELLGNKQKKMRTVDATIAFSPSTIPAGTNAVLTVTGNFSALATIQFTTADAQSGWVTPVNSQYINRTAGHMTVYVPGNLADGAPGIGCAGTGIVQITDGSTVTTSSAVLTIPYAQSEGSSNGTTFLPARHYNQNLQGGITWTMCSNLSSALPDINTALQTWGCVANINWSATSTVSTAEPVAGNGVNEIGFCTNAEGVAWKPTHVGLLGLTNQWFGVCGAICNLQESDVTFPFQNAMPPNTSFCYSGTVGSNQIDFLHNALHELGHVHLLNHVNATTDIMYSSQGTGPGNRAISAGNTSGAQGVMTLSESPNGCYGKAPMIPMGGTISPTVAYNCVPGTYTTLTASGAIGLDTYSWSTGATSASISVNPGATTTYTVTITHTYGCPTVLTSTVYVSTPPAPVVTQACTPGQLCAICPGNSSVTISTANLFSSLTYQWQKLECLGAWTSIAGATSTNYTVTSGNTIGTQYRVQVGCSGHTAVSGPGYPIVYQFPTYCNGPISQCGGRKEATLAVDEKEKEAIAIYPNPTSGNVMIDTYSSEAREVSITVYDAIGNLMLSKQVSGVKDAAQVSLDLGAYPKGLYIVRIISGTDAKVSKLILQ